MMRWIVIVTVIACTGVARADDTACTAKDVSTTSRVGRTMGRIGKTACWRAAEIAENCADVNGITVSVGLELVGIAREVCHAELAKDDLAMLTRLSKRCEKKFAGSKNKQAPLEEALCELDVAALLQRLEQPGDEED